jgi:hypothetical protein
MMTCSKCRKHFEKQEGRCPHCGEPNPETSGLYQTSTVLIAQSGRHTIYKSVEEVPARLRTRLLKSTNGANSATILIADRRGRKEIARAMRSLPGPAQRRLMHSILASDGAAAALGWLTPGRKRAIAALILLMVLVVVGLVFYYHW